MKKGGISMNILMVALYLVLTIAGLVLYKYGANKEFIFEINNGILNFKINLISIIGLTCYFFSFLVYILVLPKFDLSYLLPITSAISYIGIFLLSIFILKEQVTLYGIVGVIVILIGIILINIGGK